MPTIKEYTSPIDKLTPDERGFTAWETAGRRIGPLYNQAAADIERGGKLDEQALAQADKLGTHELDYLGLLGKQQQHAARGGGGVSGGGSRTPADQPLRTYNPGPQIANAAANITGAAAALTGHQQGRGIYGPEPDNMMTRTDQGGYNQQTPGGLSDSLTPQQVKAALAQGDALYQARLGRDAASYTNENWQMQQNPQAGNQNIGYWGQGAGMGEDQSYSGPYADYGNPNPSSPGFMDKVSSLLHSLAYGGTDAAAVAQDAQANQDAATPDFGAQGSY